MHLNELKEVSNCHSPATLLLIHAFRTLFLNKISGKLIYRRSPLYAATIPINKSKVRHFLKDETLAVASVRRLLWSRGDHHRKISNELPAEEILRHADTLGSGRACE